MALYNSFDDFTGPTTVTPPLSDYNASYDVMTMSHDDTNASLSSTVTPAPTSSHGKYGPLEDFPEFWVAYYINNYCLRIVTAIGFPGNVLSFITILRMKPYSHPCLYVAVLAVSDNCCLCVKLLFLELTRHDVDLGPYGCKFLFFAGNTTAIYANWVLVLMTVERFMAIWFPLKVSAFCTRGRAALAMAFLAVLVALLCSALFVITHHQMVDGDFSCQFDKEAQNWWYWLDGVFYALLPCVMLVVFNALIILGIRRAASIQRQLTEDSSSRNKHMSHQSLEKIRQQRQITIMLVVVCITFVALIVTNCIFFIAKPYWTFTPKSQGHARYMATEQIAFMLSDISHAVNFFVYFFSTRKFRTRLMDTLCCCRKWQRRLARSHVGQSQLSETGSIYVTTSINGGAIPLSLRNSGRY